MFLLATRLQASLSFVAGACIAIGTPAKSIARSMTDEREIAPEKITRSKRTPTRELEPIAPRQSTYRKFQLTLTPHYADIRVPFSGRANNKIIRGAGVGLELDFKVLPWIWVRLNASESFHPIRARFEYDEQDQAASPRAPGGTLAVTQGGLSIVYALDLGRILPMVDLGIGGFWVKGPSVQRNGQEGGACRNAAGVPRCDFGLSCNAESMCEQALVPEVHAGLAIDVLLREHWAIGGQVRYFARLDNPSVFPIYLLFAARLALRY